MDLIDRLAAARRCGARNRRGEPCRAPAVRGRRRCRMHGGAPGSGAPLGNRNALKHGLYTTEAIAWRRALRALLRESRALVEEV
jgi:glucans biosynthesis protein